MSHKNIKLASPRQVALMVLSDVLNSPEGVQAVLEKNFKNSQLSEKDKALCTELSYGSLRYHLRLQKFLDKFLKNKAGLPPDMPLCLGLALYELFHTRIPAYATVNSYVSLVRKLFGNKLSKVANGVLRNADRQREAYLDEELYKKEYKGQEAFLSFKYSMPEWIIRLWAKTYSEKELIRFLEVFSKAPINGLRINSSKENFSEIREELLRNKNISANGEIPYSLIFSASLPEEAQNMIDEGFLSQQSPAVHEIMVELDFESWAEPIWDACCGRGGKSLLLWERGKKIALASDTSKSRLRGLQDELDRLSLKAFPIKLMGADSPNLEVQEKFGTILIDAPCSGLGTMSRNPEIRYRRTKESLDELVVLQASILAGVKGFLRDDGCIVYLSCTINRQENEDQVGSFLDKNPDFQLAKEVKINPHAHTGEYFYGAILKRITSSG